MNIERESKIALNTIPFLSAVAFHKLIAAFGSAPKTLKANAVDLCRVDGITEKMAKQIVELDVLLAVEKELDYADKIEAEIITLGEDEYPEQVSNIFSPPPVLSIIGRVDWDESVCIAVVGTRSATTYGKLAVEKLVTDLVEKGITVVSGLARGIDGIAHRSAIKGGGRTVAVLGCGLNIYYPSEHRDLQKKIPNHGAVVSQFPFTAGPEKLTFPMRNRVISGLSAGVIVIEAGEKSGALITAYAALDDNRDVFALPGPVNSAKSVGSNKLIQKGFAKLILNADDVISELPEYVKKKLKGAQPALALKNSEPLTDEESKIMAIMDPHEAKHIDYFSNLCGLPSNIVSAILLALELKGRIKQIAGKLFIQC